MGIFAKKNKAESGPAAEGSAAAAVAEPKAKKAGKNNGLSQVLHESVLETVMDDMRSNDQFVTEVDGEEKYVGLLLDVSDIGGLDKKSRKDEAKGSIIECMNSGRIKTVITSDLMADNKIVIVPDAITLNAMDEFSLLTSAPYELCYVAEDGSTTPTGVKTNFEEVSTLVMDDGQVDELLGIEKEEESSSDDDMFSDPSASADEEDIPDLDDDEIPDLDDEDDNEFLDDDDTAPQPAGPDMTAGYGADDQSVASDYGQADYGTAGYDAGAGAYEQQPAGYDEQMAQDAPPEEEDVVPEDWTTSVVRRKFYSDDLGLEVTTEPFDAQFLQDNPYVPFNENRPEGWINDQLNEMAREANVEMERFHQENLFVMRERYFRLISMHCDRIQKDLDINDPATQYGQIYSALQAAREDELANVDMRVSRKKEELDAAWKRKLQEVGQDAARIAQHQYRERYGAKHDAEVYAIEDAVKSTIEDDYHDALHEMYGRRRAEASQLLDLGITEVLDEVADMYVQALEDENTRYHELQENMKAFIEDNRQNDIARTRALQDELLQSEKADVVLAEQTSKIRALNEDFNQRKSALEAEIARIRSENTRTVAELKSGYEDDIKQLEDQKTQLQRQIDGLLDKYKTLDERKSKEYEHRMAELEDNALSWKEKCDNILESHRKANTLYIFLIIAALIAALAIGFIGGEYLNISRKTADQESQMLEDYNNAKDASGEAILPGILFDAVD